MVQHPIHGFGADAARIGGAGYDLKRIGVWDQGFVHEISPVDFGQDFFLERLSQFSVKPVARFDYEYVGEQLAEFLSAELVFGDFPKGGVSSLVFGGYFADYVGLEYVGWRQVKPSGVQHRENAMGGFAVVSRHHHEIAARDYEFRKVIPLVDA